MLFVYLFVFLLSCLVLAESGNLVIKGLIRIARFLEWKEFIVASLLMSLVTTLPELFVGVFSALGKEPRLSFGNIIGSNIASLTLVISTGAIITSKLSFRGRALQKSSLYAPLIAGLPLILILDKTLSRIDGVIMILFSVIYFSWLLRQKDGFANTFYHKLKNGGGPFRSFIKFIKNMAIFGAGVILLLLSAQGIVFSSLRLAKILHLPILIIGLFLVALGTSTPEIAFAIKSAATRHPSMILGNALGAVVVNSTLVLGVTALICPFKILDFSPYVIGIVFTIITGLFFFLFARSEKEITRKEAVILLLIYLVFVITEVLMI